MIGQERSRHFSPDELAMHPLLARIYASRVAEPEAVHVHWRHLLPPSLAGLEAAAERLERARALQETVLIYGDYDVDGACATALLLDFLRQQGLQVVYFIPHRQREGYGLNAKGAAAALELHPRTTLLITVDNGIKSLEGSAFLAERGIDCIITDHHLPGQDLPAAVAIINPHLCDFPSKNLAGVGVAFYLAWFLQERWGKTEKPISAHLDLVALGTVADLVSLDLNNRILVSYGLRQWRLGQRLGLNALLDLAGVEWEHLRSEDIAFAVAPRLNAMGRLRHMRHSVALLLSEEPEEARTLAQACDDCNRERKRLEQELIQRADIQGEHLHWVHWPEAHEGVLGVAAAKIKQRRGRPTLVACDAADEGWIKASLRSVAPFSAKGILDAAAAQLPPEALIYGGHAAAAGLSVRRECFADLMALLDALCAGEVQTLEQHDGALPAAFFSLEWARQLSQMEPWGNGFPEPVFCNRFRVLEQRFLGQTQEHSRFRLEESASGLVLPAVYFFHPPGWRAPAAANVLFRLGVNRYLGAENLQLFIQCME